MSQDETQFPREQMRPHSRQVLVHVPKMPNGDFINKAMQHPVSMRKVWDSFDVNPHDETFRHYSRVKVFKLEPEDSENYECLGYVARRARSDGELVEDFDFNKYACIHKRYLKDGILNKKLWQSEADRQRDNIHLNLFSPGRSKDDTSTVIFDNFYQPDDTPKFIDTGKGNVDETWMAPPAFDAPDPKINIYQ